MELVLVGGCAMVLGYSARDSTQDVDAVVVSPSDTGRVRSFVERVADERDWPADSLNDGAKAYVRSPIVGRVILERPGITVLLPETA